VQPEHHRLCFLYGQVDTLSKPTCDSSVNQAAEGGSIRGTNFWICIIGRHLLRGAVQV
jgi:hypothetical protein